MLPPPRHLPSSGRSEGLACALTRSPLDRRTAPQTPLTSKEAASEGGVLHHAVCGAAEAAALGLIDEYRALVYPVLVGGGIPFFPQHERRVDLELVETRTFTSRFVYLRYRVAS